MASEQNRDATPLSQFEENPHDIEMYLNAVFNNTGDPMFVKDNECRLIVVNDAFCSIFGLSRKDIIGKTLAEKVSPKEREHFLSIDRQVLRDGKENLCEENLTTSGMQTRTILTRKNRFVDPRGKYYLIGVIRDITDRKLAEDNLVIAQEQFYQSQKMEALGKLVGGIAHDFNNILAGITGNAELAQLEAIGNKSLLGRLKNINALAFRSANLVQQLLTFSRRDRVNLESIDLTKLLKETFNLVRTGVPTNIDIELDCPHEPITIKGDSTQIHQILLNLINNSVYSTEGKTSRSIKVVLKTADVGEAELLKHSQCLIGSYALISVIDNGYGISPGQEKLIFEPFFTTKPTGKGTGLGLSMVFGAVENHHGFAEVKSTEGKSFQFDTYLPLTNEVPSNEEESMLFHQRSGETILVVDDEETLVEVTSTLLKNMGYQVLTATNGFEAVDIYKQHSNSIKTILMDVIMPECGGIEAAKIIKKDNPDISIIFATGYDQLKLAEEDIGRLAVATLQKPFTVKDLGVALSKTEGRGKGGN